MGGFEALTAMENVEADPKTDKPKVRFWDSLGLIYLLANTIQTNYRDSVKNQDGCYLGLYHLVANGRIGDRLSGEMMMMMVLTGVAMVG